VLDGLLSFLGAERANESREQIAREANQFSAEQYATRYQTTVKDLTQAGLNPMMAYSQGAGTAPSGQQAQGIENTMSTAVEGYQKGVQRQLMRQQVAQSEADVNLKNQQATNVQADTALKQVQARAAEAQAGLSTAQASKAEMEEGLAGANKAKALVEAIRTGEVQSTQIRSQSELARLYFSQVQVNKANLPKIATEIALNGAYKAQAEASARKAIAEGDITIQDLQRAINDARYERETRGVIRQTGRDLGQIAGAANQAAQADRARSVPNRRGR
jgi:hypothetical protein